MTLKSRGVGRWAAAIALPLVLVAAAPSVEQGLVYDFTVTSSSTSPDGKTRELQRMVGRGQVAGDDARVDLLEVKASGPMNEKGGYVIARDGGRTLYMVNPKEKQYFSFDSASMGAMSRAMSPHVKMSMTDVRIDVQELGAGETLHGYATRRFRLVQSYTMTVRAMGFGGTSTMHDTTLYWIAPALKNLVNPYAKMGSAAGAMDFGNPDFARQLRAANRKLDVGVPLKTITRGTSVDDKGKRTTSETIMEVTSLRRGDVPGSTFEIPSNYKEVQSPFAAMAAARDSSGAPPAAGEAEKEQAKPGAGEATKKAIRGIFRRP
jgi:hypothetical protein